MASAPSGRAVLILGIVIFFHAAFSVFEYLSIRKSVGTIGGVGSVDQLPFDLIAETIVGFIVITLGLSLTAAPLKQITWASEMRKSTIEQIDARPSFVSLDHRGPLLFPALVGDGAD